MASKGTGPLARLRIRAAPTPVTPRFNAIEGAITMMVMVMMMMTNLGILPGNWTEAGASGAARLCRTTALDRR
ncbi:MAG: hypothetical protein SGJ11_16900 [Phycisphaerae bacterium]|nr:hypothetical protein [Phycisphaerae bacterium]